jgi:dipeptidyl aminopeptidase/acylaminoacyl peptidase
MSAIDHLRAGLPPVLIMHGDKDTIAPVIQSQMFHDALEKSGAMVTFTNFPAYTHNLWHPDAIAQMAAFFKAHVMAGP